MELRQLSTILSEAVNKSEHENFWAAGATDILHYGLLAITALPRETDRTIANLRRLLNTLSANEGAVDGFMSRYLEGEALGEYRGFLGQEEKLKSSLISSGRVAVNLWNDTELKRLTSMNTADIAGLRERPMVIYLIAPEHWIKYYSVILNLFYTACFEHCLRNWNGGERMGKEKQLPVYFFLDEFGNLGKIDNFASVITMLRKRDCSVNIILQEKVQLDALYGKDAQTIFAGGCGNKLFFSGLDTETCRYLETTLGQQTHFDFERDDPERRERKVGAPLMRHDEIRMLPHNKAIFVSGGRRPVLLHMPPYFRVRALRSEAATPPVSWAIDDPEEQETAPAVTADGRPWFLQTEAEALR